MERNEIMNSFDRLYSKMSVSNEPKYMHIFGDTMRCMMKDMVDWKPEVALEYLDKLEAINWHNYLSRKEAVTIVEKMNPRGGWNITEWENNMESQKLCDEEMPYYNKWAMYVAMNMVYSDSASTIAKLKGKALSGIPKEELLESIHLLALDKLKDKDGMFDIRSYFHV